MDVRTQSLIGDLVEGIEPLGLFRPFPRGSSDLVLLAATLAAETPPKVLESVERRTGAHCTLEHKATGGDRVVLVAV
jgi:hypothetical protein